MGKLFESLVKSDDRFELPAERHLGLVTFRLKVKINSRDWTQVYLIKGLTVDLGPVRKSCMNFGPG